MSSPQTLAGPLKHGIMLERTAETITDGIRSLLLEREGYSTKVFEFVPTEHTPKNNMITAIKLATGKRSEAARHVQEILSLFDIREQHLDDLLKS